MPDWMGPEVNYSITITIQIFDSNSRLFDCFRSVLLESHFRVYSLFYKADSRAASPAIGFVTGALAAFFMAYMLLSIKFS